MAGERHLIGVDDSLTEWALLIEIARALPRDRWTLVGGLMVQVHAIRAGVEPTRFTSDVDVLVNIDASVSDVAGPLGTLGFRPQLPLGDGPFHRFRRESDIVDIMVSNAAGRARWAGRGVLRMPGAGQSRDRSDTYVVRGDGRPVELSVPDTLGAIVVKAAAFRVDSRDPVRHLQDLVVLLAAAGRNAFDGVVLSTNDRRHLRSALARLADDFSPLWTQLGQRDAEFARARLRSLVQLIHGTS